MRKTRTPSPRRSSGSQGGTGARRGRRSRVAGRSPVEDRRRGDLALDPARRRRRRCGRTGADRAHRPRQPRRAPLALRRGLGEGDGDRAAYPGIHGGGGGDRAGHVRGDLAPRLRVPRRARSARRLDRCDGPQPCHRSVARARARGQGCKSHGVRTGAGSAAAPLRVGCAGPGARPRPSSAGLAAGRAAPGRRAGLLRGAHADRDRPRHGRPAGDGEDADPPGDGEAGRRSLGDSRMTCAEFKELVGALALEALDADELLAARAHLAEPRHEGCPEAFARATATARLLSGALPEAKPRDRVWRTMAERIGERAPRRRWAVASGWAAAAAAAAVAVILAGRSARLRTELEAARAGTAAVQTQVASSAGLLRQGTAPRGGAKTTGGPAREGGGSRVLACAPQGGVAAGALAVVASDARRAILLSTALLPTATRDYQLWIIPPGKGAAPIPAGLVVAAEGIALGDFEPKVLAR